MVWLTEPVCRIRANRSVPMGGGTLRSCWLELLGFACIRAGVTVDVQRGDDAPEDTEGTGDSQEVEALQGWGEKCWRLKEGVPTGAGPGRKTGLADMLVVKLVSAVDEDIEPSMGCIPMGLETIRCVEQRYPGAFEPSGGGMTLSICPIPPM